jgi:hypothetical protein
MEHGQVIWAGAFYTARMARYQDKPAEVGNKAGHWGPAGLADLLQAFGDGRKGQAREPG